jgi:hypothetical protein
VIDVLKRFEPQTIKVKVGSVNPCTISALKGKMVFAKLKNFFAKLIFFPPKFCLLRKISLFQNTQKKVGPKIKKKNLAGKKFTLQMNEVLKFKIPMQFSNIRCIFHASRFSLMIQ